MGDNGTNESTKDLTGNLSDRQLLLLLLERVTSIDERVTNLDERVARLEKAEEDRKLETRPLWERLEGQMTQVLVRLTNIEDEQRRTRLGIGVLREDPYQEKLQRGYLAERVTEIEKHIQLT